MRERVRANKSGLEYLMNDDNRRAKVIISGLRLPSPNQNGVRRLGCD